LPGFLFAFDPEVLAPGGNEDVKLLVVADDLGLVPDGPVYCLFYDLFDRSTQDPPSEIENNTREDKRQQE